ncbi:MAG: hypothetical protein JSV91_12065 [Phycisphaerales bacterium]|nr:MAG: hypothetical protein JSV91_12065 [Phycisphaerales bacterium]
MRALTMTILAASVVAIGANTSAVAYPVEVYSVDGPQDPLSIEGFVHELGNLPPFPTDEWILSSVEETWETACWDGMDDPDFPNQLVTITNMTNIAWFDLHYVVDPETTITNFDGWIGNAGLGDAIDAFRIDWVGINRPLVFESLVVNTIFEPGETWQFIVQDYFNGPGGPASAFDSLGISTLSAPGWPPSTGSIIAREVPGPGSLCLLALASLTSSRRKR